MASYIDFISCLIKSNELNSSMLVYLFSTVRGLLMGLLGYLLLSISIIGFVSFYFMKLSRSSSSTISYGTLTLYYLL